MKSLYLFFTKMTLAKSVLLSLAPILILILEMKTTLVALSIIIFIDLLTGIRKSLHIHKISFNLFSKIFWRSISSHGMRSTWRKSYEYGIGIITFAVLDSLVFGLAVIELMGKQVSITEIAITTACLVEVYSVYENMEAVSGNNLFKKMLVFFPEKIKQIFKKQS